MSEIWTDALRRARDHAPFLALGLDRQPELADVLAKGDGEAALAFARRAGEGLDDVGTALRREKWALAVALAVGDLAGAFPLLRVTQELSDFADRALDASIADAILLRVPDCEPTGFTALALGKHGARELNYSSDIDPILLYDPKRLPRRERDDPGEAAQRVARRLVETMSKITADGYVFRVDLRLRPASEVSPLAISFDAALTHYESSALAWERAAFIRARSASGDVPAGEQFLASIRPFVWRRSLDFGAIDEIRSLTAQIRATTSGPTEPGPGFDLKRGRGGIREIEFFAQTHQMIHGGRNPALRCRGTRETLDALAAAGIIASQDALVLGEAYDRLRTVEHRLQMVDDRQTHSLPITVEGMDNVALLDGMASGEALLVNLRDVTAQVAERYDRLLDEPEARAVAVASPAAEGLEAKLDRLGFADPQRLAQRIAGWDDGRVRSLRSDVARQAHEAILPVVLEALAASPERDVALARWEALLVGLPSAFNLFKLLEARPALLDQLVRILTLAPPMAQELSRRIELLDALIDQTVLDLPGDRQALVARMERREKGDDYEQKLDQIRRVVSETRFALGVQLVEAAQDPLDIAAALCRTAEAGLQVAGEAAEDEFAQRHGRIDKSELVVLGLGRLGGGALTHASDLDVVYLFSGDGKGDSNGERPLGPTLYYNRLAQRVTAALSVPTAEGALYEVDTRLRPQGNQGPLAVSFDSFKRYQAEDAWTWEHMALCRARPIFGSDEARARLEEIIAEILGRDRDADQLKADVLKMRGEMTAHKSPSGPLDAKLLRGGLVDLEFVTHFLQLRERTGFDPNLAEALRQLADGGFVSADLIAAHDLLTRVLVAARLLAPSGTPSTDASFEALARSCGAESPDALLRRLAEARQCVADGWAESFGETLELD